MTVVTRFIKSSIFQQMAGECNERIFGCRLIFDRSLTKSSPNIYPYLGIFWVEIGQLFDPLSIFEELEEIVNSPLSKRKWQTSRILIKFSGRTAALIIDQLWLKSTKRKVIFKNISLKVNRRPSKSSLHTYGLLWINWCVVNCSTSIFKYKYIIMDINMIMISSWRGNVRLRNTLCYRESVASC